MQETDIKLAESKCPELLERFSKDLLAVEDFRGDLCVTVSPLRFKEIVRFLKESPSLSFDFMMDLFGMDYLKYVPEQRERFAILLGLYSSSTQKRIRLKVFLPEQKPEIDSLTDVYRAANWFEREAYDMYGILFRGHPKLARILCHHQFEGHPLRKDFPSDDYQRLKSALPADEMI